MHDWRTTVPTIASASVLLTRTYYAPCGIQSDRTLPEHLCITTRVRNNAPCRENGCEKTADDADSVVQGQHAHYTVDVCVSSKTAQLRERH